MVRVFSYGALELKHDGKALFKVNGQRVKHNMGNTEKIKVINYLSISEV